MDAELAEVSEESEDSEDSDDYENNMDWEEAQAVDRAQNHFAAKRESLSPKELEDYAATRIQAWLRGWYRRVSWILYKFNKEEREELLHRIKVIRQHRKELERISKFQRLSMHMTRKEWLHFCATKVQTLWRGHSSRRSLFTQFKANWVRVENGWTRTLLRGIERWEPSQGEAPQSLAFQNHRYWKRVQAAWRGYQTRKVIVPKANKFREYKRAAEAGLPAAQYNLAEIYHYGDGVAVNKAEAFKWYRAAAEVGHADACFTLGCYYENGVGVAEDKVEALKWYNCAAVTGHAGAQHRVAIFYDKGYGVAVDEAEAFKWYKRAAEGGCAGAQINLGYCYYMGIGVTADKAEATKWYKCSAETRKKSSISIK